jgi:hypothetical protein
MQKQRGEDDDLHSAASRIVREASERETLTTRAAELQGKIAESERELKAIENAFTYMNRKPVANSDDSNESIVSELAEEVEKKRLELEKLMSEDRSEPRTRRDTMDDFTAKYLTKSFSEGQINTIVEESFEEWKKCFCEVLSQSEPHLYEQVRLQLLLKGIDLS